MSDSLGKSLSRQRPLALGIVMAIIAAVPFPVTCLAMGGGNDTPTKPASPAKPGKSCPDGYKFSKQKKQCVKIACATGEVWSKSGGACAGTTTAAVTDEDLVAEGIWLAKQARYAEALETLRLVKQQNNPRALNYIGYSTRKLGRVEEGIGYYLQALKIDPGYHVVREYLGEGYLQQGKPELAKQQLAELENRCGKDCIEYRTLSVALANGSLQGSW